MTQSINNQFQRLSFQVLDNYVNSNVQGDNDKRVLNLDGLGSFKVSTTDRRYAFTRSESDKRANNETRAAVLDALTKLGLTLDNLSDKMKAAMKYEDFGIKDGRVTSTRPLSAMRLKAIVTQAKAEMAEKVAQQIDMRKTDRKLIKELNQGFKELNQRLGKVSQEGEQNYGAFKLSQDIISRMHNMWKNDTGKAKGAAEGAAADMQTIRNNLEKLAKLGTDEKVPDEMKKILRDAHDFYAEKLPELKDIPDFDNMFTKFVCDMIASRKDKSLTYWADAYRETFQHLSKIPERECKALKSVVNNLERILKSEDSKYIAKTVSEIKNSLENVKKESGEVKKMSFYFLTDIQEHYNLSINRCRDLTNLPGFEKMFEPFIKQAQETIPHARN